MYNHLIAADNLIDQGLGLSPQWIDAQIQDFDLDGLPEISLTNQRLGCLISPRDGGHLYEFDVRSICHNLLATLTRRKEAYHEKVRGGQHGGDDQVASIHDRVVFKQEGLEHRLQYDTVRRKSLVDHFYEQDVKLETIARGEAVELGEFRHRRFCCKAAPQ